jgi:hypothetical protein
MHSSYMSHIVTCSILGSWEAHGCAVEMGDDIDVLGAPSWSCSRGCAICLAVLLRLSGWIQRIGSRWHMLAATRRRPLMWSCSKEYAVLVGCLVTRCPSGSVATDQLGTPHM